VLGFPCDRVGGGGLLGAPISLFASFSGPYVVFNGIYYGSPVLKSSDRRKDSDYVGLLSLPLAILIKFIFISVI